MPNKHSLSLDEQVKELYKKYPFPNYTINTQQDAQQTQIYKLVSHLVQPYINQYPSNKIKIADVGCGTGELVLGLYEPEYIVDTFDQNQRSLDELNRRIKLLHFKNITTRQFDITKDTISSDQYDFMFCIGMLHHLDNPENGFAKLVQATRPDGYITIGLYNPYGRAQHRLKQKIVQTLAPNNIEKRVELARKLFYRRQVNTDRGGIYRRRICTSTGETIFL